MYKNFVKFINKTIGKSQVTEKASIVESRLVDYIIPSLENIRSVREFGSDYYRNNYLTNEWRDLQRKATRHGVRSNNAFDVIYHCAQHARTLMSQVQDRGEALLPNTITVEGITTPTATILKLISAVDLFVEFTSRDLYALSQYESQVEYHPTPASREFRDQHIGSYLSIVTMLLDSPAKLIDQITAMQPIVVGGSVERHPDEIVRLGFIPLVTPLFRRVAITLVNWEVEREERLRLEKRGIESAIERHRQNLSGRRDARTEQIIENWRKELVLVNKKIDSMER